MPRHLCHHCGLTFNRRDNMRRHVRACHSSIEPFRILYFCGRCFKHSTHRDTTALHVRRTHALAPETVRIHTAHEVNTQEFNVRCYIRRFLPEEEDPLVVVAPFNPFATVVQIWLSRNDQTILPSTLTHKRIYATVITGHDYRLLILNLIGTLSLMLR
jgi:hypothetical protein